MTKPRPLPRRTSFRHGEDWCESMQREYQRSRPPSRVLSAIDRFVQSWGDFRSEGARKAFEHVIGRRGPQDLCISVGGGPTRTHPNLVNVNLDLFRNVDIVGTAYALPFADSSVVAIHCEAVLEHIETPSVAVAEMFRVLVSGGEVFASTPFLQSFHAYPNHFQNFTVEGHNRLFSRAGFHVVASGACVGPSFALTDLAAQYCRHFLPGRHFSRGIQRLVMLVGLLFRPLDRLLLKRPQAHFLASSVYAHVVKP